MNNGSFIVSLIPQTPIEFVNLFADYLGPQWKDLYHFYAHSFFYSPPFVELFAIPVGNADVPRKIYVPAHYILAIKDIGEGKLPPGFRGSSQ